jgi:small neutral amino acid transporter SnatA (MarC family)
MGYPVLVLFETYLLSFLGVNFLAVFALGGDSLLMNCSLTSNVFTIVEGIAVATMAFRIQSNIPQIKNELNRHN